MRQAHPPVISNPHRWEVTENREVQGRRSAPHPLDYSTSAQAPAHSRRQMLRAGKGGSVPVALLLGDKSPELGPVGPQEGGPLSCVPAELPADMDCPGSWLRCGWLGPVGPTTLPPEYKGQRLPMAGLKPEKSRMGPCPFIQKRDPGSQGKTGSYSDQEAPSGKMGRGGGCGQQTWAVVPASGATG